jgi:hypothetical protein
MRAVHLDVAENPLSDLRCGRVSFARIDRRGTKAVLAQATLGLRRI